MKPGRFTVITYTIKACKYFKLKLHASKISKHTPAISFPHLS